MLRAVVPVAEAYCGLFSKAPPRIRENDLEEKSPSLQAGQRVRVVKPGSSFYGTECEVTNPNWQGQVKVRVEGLPDPYKSYLPEHLEAIQAPPKEVLKNELQTPEEVLENELQTLRQQFLTATGNAKTMTFEQSMDYPEIANWLSRGALTQEQIRRCWDSVASERQQNVLDFEVIPMKRTIRSPRQILSGPSPFLLLGFSHRS